MLAYENSNNNEEKLINLKNQLYSNHKTNSDRMQSLRFISYKLVTKIQYLFQFWFYLLKYVY